MQKQLKVLVVGGLVKDVTFQTKEGVLVENGKDLIRQKLLGFEFGAKLKIDLDVAEFGFGGGAGNVATSLSKLGVKVSVLAAVGDDSVGSEIVKDLKVNKVDVGLVQRNSLPSGMSVVVRARNLADEHVLFTYRGANEDLKIDLDELLKKKFDLIYVSSLSGRSAKNSLAKIFRYKQKNKQVKIAWNPGGEQIAQGLNYLKAYLKNTDVLVVNKDEAIELCLSKNNFGGQNKRINNPHELMNILAEFASGVAVVTDGANGAFARFAGKEYFSVAGKIRVKDTTGVGDAFGSTFVWAYYQKTEEDVERSMELAIKNACNVLKEVGARNGLSNERELVG